MKKIKKVPKYTPVFIEPTDKETYRALAFRIMIKIFLICLTTGGLCTVLAQYYKIPVSLTTVLSFCCVSVIIFNIGFLCFKKRAILITLLFFFMVLLRGIVQNFMFFTSHLMHTLNSRLLSTARYARYSAQELEQWEVGSSVSSAFLVICILISLLFTLAARSRYIGIILVTVVFLTAPAFGAEIAGYVPGAELLIAGMLGIYCTWVAHAGQENKPPQTSKTPLFKIIPGSLPTFYKHSRNSLVAAVLAVFAAFTAATAVPDAIKFDYKAILDSMNEVRSFARGFFDFRSGKVNDNGYFPNISSGTNISTGISLDKPPAGKFPIIRVKLEDDSEKIFLRGGIGVDFTGAEWTTAQDSSEYRQLLALLQSEDFFPESEYSSFAIQSAVSSFRFDDSTIMNRQNITIDYLVRTGFLLLPTQPYNDDYKTNKDYTWYADTVIRPKGRVRSTTFDTFCPVMSNFISINSYWGNMMARTHIIHNEMRSQYRDLVSAVYMNVPENEIDNIDRFLTDLSAIYNTMADDLMSIMESAPSSVNITPPPILFNFNNPVQLINEYLKENYAYSLEADNTTGENTAIGNFLFGTKSGHCAMYASAMTLAVRRLGYPARYVTGLVTVPHGGKTQELSESDFHAWVEVYFEGIGWLPFDPTGGAHGRERLIPEENPGGETTTQSEETTIPPIATAPETAPETAPSPGNKSGGIQNTALLPATLMILLAGFVVLVIVLLSNLKKKESAKFERFKTAGNNKTAEEMYRFMLQLLGFCGMKPATGESPLAFGERVDRELSFENHENHSLSEIMPVFEKLEFSTFPLTEEEYDCLYEYVDALYNQTVTNHKPAMRLIKQIKLT